MKVKVCGMREPDNIKELLQLPIDLIGFIFYPKSPRFVNEKKLQPWLNKNIELFGEVKRVGVFVNAEIEYILNRVHDYQLDYVQLHGNESPEYCRQVESYWEISSMRKATLIKAFHVNEDFDFNRVLAYETLCGYYIFDTLGPQYGGTGQTFDWTLLEKYRGLTPFLLSGGIGPDLAGMVKTLPYKQMAGVDVNSKFETEPGKKDIQQLASFLEELNG